MKIGNIPLASIVLLVFSLANFTIKYFFSSQYAVIYPYMDGALIGAMFVFALYYANIYFGAWVNNKKETLNERTDK